MCSLAALEVAEAGPAPGLAKGLGQDLEMGSATWTAKAATMAKRRASCASAVAMRLVGCESARLGLDSLGSAPRFASRLRS
jgi:hypothetical protein